jgi:hypothetical protein
MKFLTLPTLFTFSSSTMFNNRSLFTELLILIHRYGFRSHSYSINPKKCKLSHRKKIFIDPFLNTYFPSPVIIPLFLLLLLLFLQTKLNAIKVLGKLKLLRTTENFIDLTKILLNIFLSSLFSFQMPAKD